MLLERHWTFGKHPRWVYVIRFSSDAEWFVETEDLSVAGLSSALGSVAVPAETVMSLFSQAHDYGMEYTTEELLGFAKENVIKLIDQYDTSNAVNSFSLGGLELWVSRADRTTLKVRFESELAAGLTSTTLWYGLIPIPIADITQGLQMLVALEVYASQCYDTTAAHKAAVMALESVEAVLSYDYTQGYPDKLEF